MISNVTKKPSVSIINNDKQVRLYSSNGGDKNWLVRSEVRWVRYYFRGYLCSELSRKRDWSNRVKIRLDTKSVESLSSDLNTFKRICRAGLILVCKMYILDSKKYKNMLPSIPINANLSGDEISKALFTEIYYNISQYKLTKISIWCEIKRAKKDTSKPITIKSRELKGSVCYFKRDWDALILREYVLTFDMSDKETLRAVLENYPEKTLYYRCIITKGEQGAVKDLLFEGRTILLDSLVDRYDEIVIWFYFMLSKHKIVERVTIVFLEKFKLQPLELIWNLSVGLEDYNR